MARRTGIRWPLVKSSPEGGQPFYNQLFLKCVGPGRDPTLTWGTDVDVTGLDSFLSEAAQRWNVPLTVPPVLVKAVAMALLAHPRLLQRVVRRRLYTFRDVNMILAFQNVARNEADLLFVRKADCESMPRLVSTILRDQMRAARGDDLLGNRRLMHWLGPFKGVVMRFGQFVGNNLHAPDNFGRLARLQTAVAMVNYLNFKDAPPLHSFKAASIGVNSMAVHVAMGPTESRPIVVKGKVVVRPMAPIVVRADHRVVDAIEIGRFARTLREFLADPWSIPDIEPREANSPGASLA